jgi:hypothetical protein
MKTFYYFIDDEGIVNISQADISGMKFDVFCGIANGREVKKIQAKNKFEAGDKINVACDFLKSIQNHYSKQENDITRASKGFYWATRYSSTEEKDKQGRWARICYFNGRMIAWVNRVDHIDYGRYFSVRDFFPSLENDSPCLSIGMEREKDFETIKKEVEQRFAEFLKAVWQER